MPISWNDIHTYTLSPCTYYKIKKTCNLYIRIKFIFYIGVWRMFRLLLSLRSEPGTIALFKIACTIIAIVLFTRSGKISFVHNNLSK